MLPWYRLGSGNHRDKLGTVGDLLLHLRAGCNVGPHLYQSHLVKHTRLPPVRQRSVLLLPLRGHVWLWTLGLGGLLGARSLPVHWSLQDGGHTFTLSDLIFSLLDVWLRSGLEDGTNMEDQSKSLSSRVAFTS